MIGDVSAICSKFDRVFGMVGLVLIITLLPFGIAIIGLLGVGKSCS